MTYLGLESAIDFTLFQQGIPEERFDVYIDFSFSDVAFTLDSSAPPASETFTIMQSAITVDYIRDWVRQIKPSPFASTIEVVFAASEDVVEVPAPAPETEP